MSFIKHQNIHSNPFISFSPHMYTHLHVSNTNIVGFTILYSHWYLFSKQFFSYRNLNNTSARRWTLVWCPEVYSARKSQNEKATAFEKVRSGEKKQEKYRRRNLSPSRLFYVYMYNGFMTFQSIYLCAGQIILVASMCALAKQTLNAVQTARWTAPMLMDVVSVALSANDLFA